MVYVKPSPLGKVTEILGGSGTDEAKQIAQTAQDIANEAKDTADLAKGVADNIDSKATSAQTDASNAVSTANAASAKADDNANKIGIVQQNLGDITQVPTLDKTSYVSALIEETSRRKDIGVNVKDFNASGSTQNTTGSIVSGSNQLTVSSIIDFKVGQGIYIAKAGAVINEVVGLQITGAATTSGNVTVTLDGVAYTVAVNAGDSRITVASKIRAAVFTGWTTGGVSASNFVSFTCSATGDKTDPTFSAGTTGVIGSIFTSKQGVSPLISKIIAINGTTLTLADNATTTVTNQTVAHDDTVALQSFIDYVTTNALKGIIPAGTYTITSELTVSSRPGWAIFGANANSTYIIQKTDNKNILHFVNTPSYCHSNQLRGITFNYTNAQSAANTGANCIQMDSSPYECTFDDLVFNGGNYGIYVPDTAISPWGCTFDNLRFGGTLSTGSIRFSVTNGIPNNRFGRILSSCTNMIGPVMVLKGYDFVIDTLEFLDAQLGAELINFAAGAQVEIGALKLENGTYTGTTHYLFELNTSCKIHIGQVTVAGSSLNIAPSSGFYLFRSSGGSPSGVLTIGHIELGGNSAVTNAYAFSTIGFTIINTINFVSGWVLNNLGSSDAAEYITINSYKNNQLSQNKGDADYTVALGDKSIFTYDTVLTAPRVCTLPNDGNNMFNGLKYRAIIGNGVATATNTITFKSGTTTLATINTGKVAIEFTWRRNAANAANGWVVTDYTTLP